MGNVFVTGTLSATTKLFRIDHPLNPKSKYLVHASVESPDMKTFYDGVVTLDKKGKATVRLPRWFEALNKDFRYQLTPIGAPARPDLLVLATELAGVGGPELPLEVSAIDSIPAATDAPERSLRIIGHQQVSLLNIRDGDAVSCDVLERCLAVSRYLLAGAPDWLS